MKDTERDLIVNFEILKRQFPNYEHRPQQLAMASDALRTLEEKGALVVEAGTGVGKSFAYLIPAILTKEKTIISTATIALQEQLVSKDLVFLHDVLPQPFSFELLKGKNNYLCIKRQREYSELSEAYIKFRAWTIETQTGQKDELPFIPDFWSHVCGDSQDCSSVKCPFYHRCFYYEHYRKLTNIDILVVNHYLLAFDMISAFKMLPFHKQLIIDEAHELDNVISNAFGSMVSHSRLKWLLQRLKGFNIAIDPLMEAVDRFFRQAGQRDQTFYPIPEDVIRELCQMFSALNFTRVIGQLDELKLISFDEEIADRIKTTISYIKSLKTDIEDFIARADSNKAYYATLANGMRTLRSSLVESKTPFGELAKAYESIIMTSATLTANGAFDFFKNRLGVEHCEERIIGSPFNFAKQALLYLERSLPWPDQKNTESFQQQSVTVIENLIKASKGRALVLFTSYSALNFTAKNLRIDYPFKTQGDMPPTKLIEWLKNTPNSTLLATATFWQGVDIKGDALSLVVIVKLPFSSPGDPLYQERCNRLGDRWFSELALPSAILLMRQGFGRLIRGSDDYGVVAILDPRIVKSSYGKMIVSSLPKVKPVYDIKEVKTFFDRLPNKTNAG
jgi:ATP-dependent DNA helicase DinG